MLLKILFVLSCNVLLIKSLDDKVIINGSQHDSCFINPEHTFTDGQTVTILTQTNNNIVHGFWRINDTKIEMDDFKGTEIVSKDIKVNSSLAGKWTFELLSQRDNNQIRSQKTEYNGHNYTQRICSTMVKIVLDPPLSSPNILIILITVGVVFTLIILAQAAYIVYLKAKAKALNRHENLSKKSKSVSSNDGARYCSNPRQKAIKVAPIIDPDRDSAIYEAPHIELPERGPAQPPQPPAVATIPRTPRIETDMGRLGPLALAAALTGSRQPTQTGTYPTPKTIQHEINVANRPPLPLPLQETYEEMPVEENTYEPPPIKNTLPQSDTTKVPPTPRSQTRDDVEKSRDLRASDTLKTAVRPPAPQKLSKHQLDTMVKALSMKPAVTPKPQIPTSDHMKIPNELENAWRKRNVVQVPIVSIPGPSSRGASPHKPRPPPVVKSKPPIPQPVEQDIYYNESQDSSDEEWTYEPLKPVKGYSGDNIYNV